MPPSFALNLERGDGLLVSGGSGLAAPADAEKLFVKLTSVGITGGLPQLASETAARQAKPTGRRVPGAEVFAAARDLEAAYATSEAAYATSNVPVRVLVPPQQLTNDAWIVANNCQYVLAQAAGKTTALSVTARPIIVTADALSRDYGDANPTLTHTIGGRGLVNGDTLSGALAGVTGTSGVGTYSITLRSLANSNLTISCTGANLTVNQRAITVAADTLRRNYDFTNPALTYTVGRRGLINGDLLSGALSTYVNSSIADCYVITRGSLSASANDNMTLVPGTLTIDRVINPPTSDLAGTVVNGMPSSIIVTTAMQPVNYSLPSGSGSGQHSSRVLPCPRPGDAGPRICKFAMTMTVQDCDIAVVLSGLGVVGGCDE